jgi:NADH-quinone oxidoreductase subunit N
VPGDDHPLLVGRNAKTVGAAALVGVAVIGFFTVKAWGLAQAEGMAVFAPPAAGAVLIVDTVSVFFKLTLLVFLVGVTVLWWICSSDREADATEFFVLLLGSALGMSLMVSTQHLLMMVLAIEFASLPSYAIVGFEKRNLLAAEASLKYVVFGAVCAAIMLYGVSLLYGFFGTLDVAVIAQGAADRLMTPGPDRLLVGIALFCVLCGIAFKISAVPFHFWCPDAFQGAKIEVTTWLSVASKAAGLVLLLRLVHAFSAHLPPGIVIAPAIVIGIIASITCTVGNLAAYWQTSVKRMLAYSSIAHAGYMMMAAAIFAAAAGVPAFPAISAVLAYIVVYLFMNLGAFGVTALVARANGGDDSLTAFSGLMRRAPGLAVPMLFCLISLVGIPPFAGFLAKYFLLMALGEVGGNLHYALIVVAVLNSLLSLWYYMRVVVQMMLKDSGEPVVRVPVAGNLLVNVCGVLLIVLLVFGSPLKRRVDQVAAGMYAKPVMTASAGDVAHSVNVDQSVPTE